MPERGRSRGLLEGGEIDALISADIPRCVIEESPRVGRLFDEYETRERDYYRRTGVFPIMHTVVVNRELAVEQPELVRSVFRVLPPPRTRWPRITCKA